MKDKEKYFNIIEKDIITDIYEESVINNKSYFDRFMQIAKGYKEINAHVNYIERCVMANDYESLIYLVVSNKIIKFNDKLYNVINNEIQEELSNKLSLDIIRILVSNKFVTYAMSIMTNDLYYKVHFLKDLKFLEEKYTKLYLFGNKEFPCYFINQFNDFELDEDKERILDALVNYYGGILDEVPKYYHSSIDGNKLVLEYPSDLTKRDKRVEFKFIDLDKLEYSGEKLNLLKNIEKRIRNLVKKEKEYAK